MTVITLVYIVMVILIVTKLMDVLSTLIRVKHPESETNPIARKAMVSVGVSKAVWGVFIVALAITAISAAAALNGGLLMQVLFIAIGISISIVQFSVAYFNWTGRDNLITKGVRVMHKSLHKCNLPLLKYFK